MQRRHFLSQSFNATLFLTGMPSVAAWAAEHETAVSASEMETLAVMVRGLLPHDFLADEDYVRFAQRINARLGSDPGLRELIIDGVDKQNAASGGSWLEASADDKLRVLQELESEPCFGHLLNAAIDTLYQDPAVYRRLGYEGSAIEFGGYLNRGFDDIDWLPVED
jgi:hypothetical protein